LKADRVANKAFLSLDEDVLVAEAAKTMYQREECTIIVTRNDAKTRLRVPVGIVTERDIIFRVVAQNRGPFKVTLKDIMTSPLIAIDSEASVDEALSIMKEKEIGRLPLLNKKGIVVSLLTAKELVKKAPVKVAQA
jgi:CBS domain-containing protein